MSTRNGLTLGTLAKTELHVAIGPAVILLLAGDWRWAEGWAFSIWFVALSTASMLWMYLNDPALLAERFRKAGTGGQESWDRRFVQIYMACVVAWHILVPLDAKRFSVTPRFPLWLELTGAAMLLLSSYMSFSSFRENTFLSPFVRLQSDRSQHVISTGVYGVIRHPMYLGTCLMFLGGPLLLGSISGLILGVAIAGTIVMRIRGEEHMLLAKLRGYYRYRKQVRYRLLPFVW